jgi:Protein of unknown function (DUF2568)
LLKKLNLAVRFVLELCALGALAYWGIHTGTTAGLRVSLAIGLPLLVAVFWGSFVSPKAPFGGSRLLRLLLGFVVFALAAAAIISTGHPILGWVYGAAALINTVLTYVWGPQPGETSPAA